MQSKSGQGWGRYSEKHENGRWEQEQPMSLVNHSGHEGLSHHRTNLNLLQGETTQSSTQILNPAVCLEIWILSREKERQDIRDDNNCLCIRHKFDIFPLPFTHISRCIFCVLCVFGITK